MRVARTALSVFSPGVCCLALPRARVPLPTPPPGRGRPTADLSTGLVPFNEHPSRPSRSRSDRIARSFIIMCLLLVVRVQDRPSPPTPKPAERRRPSERRDAGWTASPRELQRRRRQLSLNLPAHLSPFMRLVNPMAVLSILRLLGPGGPFRDLWDRSGSSSYRPGPI